MTRTKNNKYTGSFNYAYWCFGAEENQVEYIEMQRITPINPHSGLRLDNLEGILFANSALPRGASRARVRRADFEKAVKDMKGVYVPLKISIIKK
jgi:hypothetical protein